MNVFTALRRLALIGSVAYILPFASATQILVGNSSFDTLPAGGLPYSCGADCTIDDYTAIPDWTTSGSGIYGQMQVDPGNTIFQSVPVGNTLAFSSGMTLSQVVDVTVQAGVTYTLSVDLGFGNNDGAFGGGADLLINGVAYSATGTQPAIGQWSTYTVSYTGLNVDMGDTIAIQLTDFGGDRANFNDVQLSDSVGSASPNLSDPSSVPEPGSLGLAGLALVALTALYRRKIAARAESLSS